MTSLGVRISKEIVASMDVDYNEKITKSSKRFKVLEIASLKPVKADLDGTTFAYDCRMRFLERALLAFCKKSHTTLVIQHYLYLRLSQDFKRILRHFFVTYTTVVSEL